MDCSEKFEALENHIEVKRYPKISSLEAVWELLSFRNFYNLQKQNYKKQQRCAVTVDSRFKTSIRWILFFFHQFPFYFVIAHDPIVEKHFCKIYKNKFCKITKTKLQKLISVRCFGWIMLDCPQLEPQ